MPPKNCTASPFDHGSIWARKTISELWEFAWAMWLHRNSSLHDPTSTDCHQMKGVAVNAAITALYAAVDTYSAQDRWRFDMPLALRLRTRLQSRNRWLLLTKVLIEKSTNTDPQGQSWLTTYFQVINTLWPRLTCLQPLFLQPSNTSQPDPPPSPPLLTSRRPQDPESHSL
jgi:hypothetical protein